MINKAHKLVLKSFLEIKMPDILRSSEYINNFISLDSYIGGYCQTLLSSRKGTIDFNGPLISKKEKELFNKLINNSNKKDKEELVIYYKSLLLVEGILDKYNTNKNKITER